MEVAGVVFRPAACFSSTTNSGHSHSFSTMKQPGSLAFVAAYDQFSDKGHLQYYEMKEKETTSKKKEMKKKLKLLKGLSKNLSTFSDMGFGLNPDEGLDHQVKGQMISEASELLLAQLQKLRAEKLESKKKKKEEKAKKKAAQMMMMDAVAKESASSESSSSSEFEREKVVARSCLKSSNAHQETPSSLARQILEPSSGITNSSNVGFRVDDESSLASCKKIEVCMGGKCKKSGAAVLLENFQAAVGGEAAVVGCKCMGKCRDGPNVRVRSNQEEGMMNPLCIGVGLDDVDKIVTNFFGGNRSGLEPALSGGGF